jgi:hypothetical protein
LFFHSKEEEEKKVPSIEVGGHHLEGCVVVQKMRNNHPTSPVLDLIENIR